MKIYKQRFKFFIIITILSSCVLCFFWYNNNVESKIDFIDKRIDLLDRELLEASKLPDKIDEAFIKYNNGKSKLELLKESHYSKKILEEKIKSIASRNKIVIKGIALKEVDYFRDLSEKVKIDDIPFYMEKVQVNAVGNFLDIGDFLEQVIRDINMLSLNSCEFDLDKDNDRQVNASIEFRTYNMETI